MFLFCNGEILAKCSEGINYRIRYTGQQYDQVTGQHYLRARYYNPVIGRFIQEDTYRGDGLNLYAYCGNNPVMYHDPSGRYEQEYSDDFTTESDQSRVEQVDTEVDNGASVAGGSSKTVKELISESDAAKKWGMLEDGTNQGVRHFSDYWEQYPERIPSLEQRLGVQENSFNNSLDGFNNFTSQAEHVISEATLAGNVRNINGKSIYYIDGADNHKKGVVVIVREGKIQSMMPSDFKSFNKML